MKFLQDIYARNDDAIFNTFFFLLRVYLRKDNYFNYVFSVFYEDNGFDVYNYITNGINNKMLLKYVSMVMFDDSKVNYVPEDIIIKTLLLKHLKKIKNAQNISPLHRKLFLYIWDGIFNDTPFIEVLQNMVREILLSDFNKILTMKYFLKRLRYPSKDWLTIEKETKVIDNDSQDD